MFHLTKFDKEIKTSQSKSVGADLLSKACDLDQKKACYQYGSMCLRGEVIPVSIFRLLVYTLGNQIKVEYNSTYQIMHGVLQKFGLDYL